MGDWEKPVEPREINCETERLEEVNKAFSWVEECLQETGLEASPHPERTAGANREANCDRTRQYDLQAEKAEKVQELSTPQATKLQ